MDTHPITILIGIIGTFLLISLVSLGFSCIGYKMDPDTYPILKPYYE